ncbi:TonB-dependent receptor domain-containing protein [Candidatus Magnetaquicoccus inordinatus]|uniref:TonB-dependent receptor domain-containing protein n=1 Tax=Candidatus Magnetaquicoccus inordinatus TaxID=2496818 RepID=UPI00102ACE28|nr:TonB-dependent receptor [Candidatus Magnetaquicoccus inordinatus]
MAGKLALFRQAANGVNKMQRTGYKQSSSATFHRGGQDYQPRNSPHSSAPAAAHADNRRALAWALLTGAAHLLAALPAVADDLSFVIPQRLTRHGSQDFPELIPLDKVLTAAGTITYSHPAATPWNPIGEALNNLSAPLAISGHSGLAATEVLAARVGQQWSADSRLIAAFRHERQQSYNAADGQAINSGLRREAEYLLAQKGSNNGSRLTLYAVRDLFSDSKVPQYNLDAPQLQRQLLSLTASSLPLEGYFDRLDLQGGWYQMTLLADNESLREPIAQRIAVEGDAGSWQASARFSRREGGWLTFAGSVDHYDSTRYGHEYGPNRITAIRMPDAQSQKMAVEAGSRWQQNAHKLEGGLRLDLQQSDLERADQRPNAPGAAGAFYNFTPRELYQRYYGSRELNRSLLEPSGRLRLEYQPDSQQLWFLDGRRAVRMPELVELYMANSGVAELVQVGNPHLKAEKHHRLEAGGRFKGDNFVRYGRGGKAGSLELRLSGFVDHIKDFIAIERAHGQTGILRNDEGFVQRNLQANLLGLQAELLGNIRPGLSTRLHLLGQSGKNVTEGTPLYQVPPLELNLFVDAYGEEEPWNSGLRLRLVNERRAVDTRNHGSNGPDWGGAMAGFATLDLYGGYQISKQLALSAGLANVTNRLYREALPEAPQTATTRSLPAPGRTLHLQFCASF